MKEYYTLYEAANLLGKSKETLRRWDKEGKLEAVREPMSNYRVYRKDQLQLFEELGLMSRTNIEPISEGPATQYNVLELFAGAGGLAIGLEKAGLNCLELNELDHWAAETLGKNQPEWNVVEGDNRNISFAHLKSKVDVVTGGFPCPAFSYAGASHWEVNCKIPKCSL